MKYTVLFETTSTHECTVELPDDHFEDSSPWSEVPECDGSASTYEEECKAILISNDKGEEVWTI